MFKCSINDYCLWFQGSKTNEMRNKTLEFVLYVNDTDY